MLKRINILSFQSYPDRNFLAIRRFFYTVLIFILVSLSLSGCQQEEKETVSANKNITVTDSQGTKVVLSKPAQRIVTLIPHAAEMVISAGAAERLVGVSDRTDLPKDMNVPSIGAYNQTNLESIFAQNPDLVIAWSDGSDQGQLQKIKAAGIPIYVSNPIDLESIAKEVVDIGVLTNTEVVANKNAKVFLTQLQEIQNQYKDEDIVSVFIQLGSNPMYTVSDNSFLGKLLQYCHAENAFGSMPQPALKINQEQVIKVNPKVIVTLGEPEVLDIWKQWPIDAQKNQHLYAVSEKQLGRPSLQILPDLKNLCEKIHRARQ